MLFFFFVIILLMILIHTVVLWTYCKSMMSSWDKETQKLILPEKQGSEMSKMTNGNMV